MCNMYTMMNSSNPERSQYKNQAISVTNMQLGQDAHWKGCDLNRYSTVAYSIVQKLLRVKKV